MSFYYLQLLIFLIYSFFFFLIRPNLNRTYYFVTGVHLTSIMGMRSIGVGSDTALNVNSYLTISNFDGHIIIYDLLKKYIYQFSNGNYHVFLFLLSAITVAAYLYSVYNIHSTFFEGFLSIYFYITLYYYFNAFNVQRQMMAVSVSLLIIVFLFKGRKRSSILMYILALFIHNTSFISLVNFFVYKIKKNKKTFVLVITFTIILFFFINTFFNLFVSIFDHYEIYSKMNFTSNGGNVFFGIFILFFVILSVFFDRNIFYDNKISTLTYLSTIAAIMYIFGSRSALVVRMADYFGIFVPLFLPMSLKSISKRYTLPILVRYLLYFMVMVAAFIVLYFKLSKNMGQIIPYQL